MIKCELLLIGKWICKKAKLNKVWVSLFILLFLGGGVRFYFLSETMRFDEVDTFFNFAHSTIYNLFNYPYPNNHVLHTILVRLSIALFGTSPIAIRLPAFISGILVLPVSFIFPRLLIQEKYAGLLTCGMVAVYPYLILFDTLARGYSLVILLSLLLAILLLHFVDSPTKTQCFLVSLVVAMGHFVMPSFLFSAAGLYFWATGMMLVRKRSLFFILKYFLIPSIIMIIIMTLLFYTPTIIVSGGIRPVIANEFVKALPWLEFKTGMHSHFSDVFRIFMKGISPVIILLLIFVVLLSIGFHAKRKNWDFLLLLPSLFLGLVIVLLFSRSIPYPRTWLYLFPFFFALVDGGASVLFSKMKKASPVFICLITGISALYVMEHKMLRNYTCTGSLPEAPVLVEILYNELQPGEEVIAKGPAIWPLHYYWWQKNVPMLTDEVARWQYPLSQEINNKTSVPFRTFYIIKKGRYKLRDLNAPEEVQKFVELENAVVYVDYGEKAR